MWICIILDVLKDEDKHQMLYNIGNWDCVLGNGMNNQMFDLITYSSIYCEMDCQVLFSGGGDFLILESQQSAPRAFAANQTFAKFAFSPD